MSFVIHQRAKCSHSKWQDGQLPGENVVQSIDARKPHCLVQQLL